MICIKKVELQITFFKKWILKSICEDNTDLSTFLKRTLKNGIIIENGKIASLFGIKSFMGFCWLIMDSKHNLLSLNSNTPKKVIIIGIDIKQFYNVIIDKSLNNQVRLLNAYISRLYGFKLYEDTVEEEIKIEPIKKDTMKEIIEPVVALEKKVEIPKKEKPVKKQEKRDDKAEIVNKNSIVAAKGEIKKRKEDNLQKKEKVEIPKDNTKSIEEKSIKEERKVVKKVVKDKPEDAKVSRSTIDEVVNNELKKAEVSDVIEKRQEVKKDLNTETEERKKGSEVKKDLTKEQEPESKKAQQADVKKKEESEKKKKENVKKKREIKEEKKEKQKPIEKNQDDEIPEEILITLKLDEKENNDKDNLNNDNTLIVSTSKDELKIEKKEEKGISTYPVNEQKITFTIVSPNGEILYSKVIINTVPMTVEKLLKRTGLPIKDDLGFVESIAGINNQGMSGWVYEVNGAPVMVSAADYIVNPKDQITWKYINFSPIDLPLEEDMEFPMDSFIEEPVGKKMR